MPPDFQTPPDFVVTLGIRAWLLERFKEEEVDAMSREEAYWELIHGDC